MPNVRRASIALFAPSSTRTGDRRSSPDGTGEDSELRRLTLGRVAKLERLALAEQVGPSQWTLKPASSPSCAISSWPPHRVAPAMRPSRGCTFGVVIRRSGIATGEVRMVPAVASAEPLLF